MRGGAHHETLYPNKAADYVSLGGIYRHTSNYEHCKRHRIRMTGFITQLGCHLMMPVVYRVDRHLLS